MEFSPLTFSNGCIKFEIMRINLNIFMTACQNKVVDTQFEGF